MLNIGDRVIAIDGRVGYVTKVSVVHLPTYKLKSRNEGEILSAINPETAQFFGGDDLEQITTIEDEVLRC